jgi:hypothetical protein
LRGRGYIFVHSFPRDFAFRHPLGEDFRGRFRGGPGAILLVDYLASPVGPYRELLFLGRFEVGGSARFSIPRIFVSSAASALGGRANWGLPKELADFEWTSQGPRRERVRVSTGNGVFFDASLEWGHVAFPVLAARWPLPFTVAQPFGGRTLLTTLRGVGLARRARLASLTVDEQQFPDTAAVPPRLALRIAPFRLAFEAPTWA